MTKIKVKEVEVGVEVTCVGSVPSGAARWKVDYIISDICVHSAYAGPIFGRPSPIEMLDETFELRQMRYQDIPDPEPYPEDRDRVGRNIGRGTSGGRPAWWEVMKKTHRQAIIDAIADVVVPEVVAPEGEKSLGFCMAGYGFLRAYCRLCRETESVQVGSSAAPDALQAMQERLIGHMADAHGVIAECFAGECTPKKRT